MSYFADSTRFGRASRQHGGERKGTGRGEGRGQIGPHPVQTRLRLPAGTGT